MDEHDDAIQPPEFLSDPLASPAAASEDAFAAMLGRHRKRQWQVVGPVLAAALVVGVGAGFAVGRGNSSGDHTTVAAASRSATSQSAAAAVPAGGKQGPGGSMTAAIAAPIGGGFVGSGPSTQELLRNSTDGVRIRLYSQTFQAPSGVPMIKCATTTPCPQPAIAACLPSKNLLAEVSDDQVAGDSGAMVAGTPPAAGFTPESAIVVGAGQPQPILVVLGWAGTGVTSVGVTTSYGTDSQAVTAPAWVALAVQLPANYTTAGSSSGATVYGVPDGTVTAVGGSGSSVALSSIGFGKGVMCGTALPPVGVKPVCQTGSTGSAGVPPGAPERGAASPPNQAATSGATTSGATTSGGPTSGGGQTTPSNTVVIAPAPPVTCTAGGGSGASGSASSSSGSVGSGSSTGSSTASGSAGVASSGPASSTQP